MPVHSQSTDPKDQPIETKPSQQAIIKAYRAYLAEFGRLLFVQALTTNQSSPKAAQKIELHFHEFDTDSDTGSCESASSYDTTFIEINSAAGSEAEEEIIHPRPSSRLSV